MTAKKLHYFVLWLSLLSLPFLATAQKTMGSNGLWTAIGEKSIPQVGTRYITPTSYKTYKLNLENLQKILDVAPMEFTPVAQMTKTYLELPMPDGTMKAFDIVESPIMAAELSARFPEINTYAGYAVDDKNIFVRFDLTPQGFHAMILIPGSSTVYIDPYSFGGGDTEHYTVYYKKDYASSINKHFECGVTETYDHRGLNHQPDLKSAFGSCELRTYRLALAATGEYTAFHGGTVALAQAAQVTTMNRVNAVYGREMAIRMNIVANNNLLVYTNAGTDPYSNNNGVAMLTENQNNVTTLIGSANYDIGHVFSTGGGGIAGLGVVCSSTNKARGVTGSPAPVGDPFDIDYVAHEMGHQFACNHTFNNSDDGSCNGNTNTPTSMEPGSGSTIMAYAGICSPSDVQSNSDDYFHTISLQEMGAFITAGGHTCPVKTPLTNNTPSVTAGSTVVIPQGTPFFLTATGTDPDATNVLTYCWEQTNTGTATTSPSATATAGANFRSFDPTTNPTRFFPSLAALAANGPFTWEVLPTVARTMTFRTTVRDNATGGGCTASANVTVTVSSAAGPFVVTNPTNTGITWVGASAQTVTWNVAGTTGAPVSCANVDILISTDGGLTYTVLVANTPNDGTQAVTAPNTPSTTCRIQVRCAGGNFFDISNNNFTITAATNDYTLAVPTSTVSICQPANAVYTINSGSIGGYSSAITLSVTGVPVGATSAFATNPITPGASTTLTISNTGAAAPGTYNLTLTGNSVSGTKTVSLVLVISTGTPTAVTLLAPANGATNVAMPVAFSWTAASGTGVTYAIQISTSPTFVPIIDQASGLGTNSFSSIALSPSTTYHWRVTASNGCGTAPASATFNFTTGQSGCDTISNYDLATDTARIYSAGAGLGYVAGHNTYGDLAKADKFNYTGPNTHIKGAYIGFGRAVASNASNTFFARVWDGTSGSPTTVLASVPVTYQSVQALIAGGSNVGFVSFGSVPLPASKIFFVGIEFVYGNDTIALITNTVGQTIPATAWEKASNGTWFPYDNASSWGIGVAHYIFPVLGTPPNANFTPLAPTVCSGSSTLFTNTSTAAATYAWTLTGGTPATSTATNPSVVYSAPGTFNVQLIATNDCMSDTATTTVTVSSVTASISATTNVSCNGGSNGSLTAAGTGGTAPYSFLWSNGRTTAANTGLVAGTYSVTVTSANGCSATTSGTVTQPTAALASTATSTNVSCFGGANGAINLTVTGGTTAYSFNWGAGVTTEDRSALAAGTYTVTISDANACTATRSVTITQPTAALASTATSTNVSCFGGTNGAINLTVTGGTLAYSFNWGAGVTTEDRSALAAGTYTVTISDANACTATRSVTITQPTAALASTATSTNVSCFGGTNGAINLTVTGGTTAYSFNWGAGVTTEDRSALAAGTYTVTISDANACTATRSVTITQPASALALSGTSTSATCVGNDGTATAVVSGGTTAYSFLWSNGRTTATNTGLTPAVYNVTVTDANGCSASTPVTVGNSCAPCTMTATATSTNVSCFGGNNGLAAVTTTGGTAPVTFLWSNGRTTASNTGLTAGTYTVTATDNAGCTATATAVVAQPTAALASTATSTNVSCFGGTNGAINLTVTGGTTAYSFNWGAGVTTEDRSALAAGTYTVTISDANACTATRSVTITQPTAALASTATSTNVSCFGGTNGAINLTVTGGTTAYSFNWGAGVTTEDRSALAVGTYTVTISDANACTATRSVTITQPTALTIAGTSTPQTCTPNTGSAIVTVGGGTAAYSFNWANGQTTATATGLSQGTYAVTATDANGCAVSTVVTVGNSCAPCTMTATATSTNVSCFGGNNGSAAVTTTGGTAPVTFLWSNGRTTASNTGLTAGTYTVTATDNAGCTATATAVVTQPTAALASTATSTNISCFGGTNGAINLTVTGGTTAYSFNWGAGVTTEDRSGLAAGTYTVTISDANACTATRSVTITQPTALTIAGTSTPQTCTPNTGSAIVTVGGGNPTYSFNWANGQTTATATGLSQGIYPVTATDANGCSVSTVVTVGNSCAPCTMTATATSTNVSCFGGNNGSATVATTGGTAPVTFLWSNGRTTASNTGLTAGTYTVTATDNAGCTATATAVVAQPTAALASTATSTNVSCFGGANGAINLTVTGGTTTYSFNWGAGVTTEDRSGLAAGTYTVTISDANACTATRSVTITQPTAALASTATSTNVSCFGGTNGAINLTVTGGTTAYSFNWGAGVTTEDRSALAAGTYTVTISDANACTATRSVTITQPTALTIAGTSTPQTCTPNTGSAIVTVGGGTATYSFNWASGQTTATATGLSQGVYPVTATDANGCSVSTVVTVGNSCSPCTLAGSATNTNVSCFGGNNASAVAVPAGGTAPISFLWSNGRTTATNTGLTAGTYTVTMTDASSCTATASVTVTQPTTIIAVVTATNVSCAANDGLATASVTGGTPAYTFLWSNGRTTATITGLTQGVYNLTITDANACNIVRVVTVGNSCAPCTLAGSATNTNVSCFGGNNASAVAVPAGGTAPISFLWSNGRTTATNTGLTAGTYTVTMTDASSCTATASVTVTQPSVLNVFGTSNPATCAGNDGLALITVFGGTPNYTILWSNAVTSTNNPGLAPGVYSVTATDANGCSASTTVTVGNSCSPCTLAGSATNTNVSCAGGNNATAVAVPAGGTAPISFLWSNGRTTATNTGLTAGTYTVTITDASSCTATASVTVTQPTTIVAVVTATNVSCAGNDGSATASVTGGTPAYTFLWSNGRTTATITGLTQGVYNLTITDANGCNVVRVVTVGNSCSCAGVAATITGTNPLCAGACNGTANAITSGMTAPVSFVWSNSATAQNISGLCAGVYRVTATDANGCSASASLNVFNPNPVNVTGSSTPDNCSGNSGTATAVAASGTAPYSFAWSNGAVGATASGLTAGVYFVTATDANGCSASAALTVGNSNSLSALAIVSQNASCAGYNDGEAQATSAGAPNPAYQWSNGSTGPIASGLTAGVYSVTVSSGICSVVRSVTVTQPAAMNLVMTSTHIPCVQNSGVAAISASGGAGAPYSFIWSTGATGQTVSGLASGTHSVTVTDNSGCSSVSSTSINITQGPSISSTASQATCSGVNDGAIAVSVSPAGSYGFVWNTGATTQSVSGLGIGVYSVVVSDPVTGCIITHRDTITSPATILASFSIVQPTLPGSTNGALTVAANGGTAPYSFVWNTGSTSDQLLGIGIGTYIVTITDANGCFAIDTVVVNAFTGIELSEQITQFVVMPNPNNGYFTIQIDLAAFQNAEIRMTDVLGRNIYEQKLEGQSFTIPMDWNRLAGGTYFVTLRTEKDSKTHKVIIAK